MGLSGVNAGDLTETVRLQPLVAAAVGAADNAADQQADAIRRETAVRIQEWIGRTQRWKRQADDADSTQSASPACRRIDDEQSLAQDMNPDRRLVRPLIVVVPQDFTTERQG